MKISNKGSSTVTKKINFRYFKCLSSILMPKIFPSNYLTLINFSGKQICNDFPSQRGQKLWKHKSRG